MIWEHGRGCEIVLFPLFFYFWMYETNMFFLLFLVHWKLQTNKINHLFESRHPADHFVFAIALWCLLHPSPSIVAARLSEPRLEQTAHVEESCVLGPCLHFVKGPFHMLLQWGFTSDPDVSNFLIRGLLNVKHLFFFSWLLDVYRVQVVTQA